MSDKLMNSGRIQNVLARNGCNIAVSGQYFIPVVTGTASPTAGDAATYGAGCIYLDTTNSKLYLSNGTIWKYWTADG